MSKSKSVQSSKRAARSRVKVTRQQRSEALANEIIALVRQSQHSVDAHAVCVALNLSFQTIWSALGGSEGALLAFVAASLSEGPCIYYGPRSRYAH